MSERMTDERLAEITQRHEQDDEWETWSAAGHKKSHADRAALLRHVEALEQEAQKREEGWREHVIGLHDQILTLEQEVERLRKIHSKYDLGALLETYILLHKGKVTAHWLWVAIERIGGGETVAECLEDYGYAPLARAEAAERKLARLVEAVIGWREHDWPAWFCRRTAEAIADRVREIQATGEGK